MTNDKANDKSDQDWWSNSDQSSQSESTAEDAVAEAWNAYVSASQARREVQAEVLHAVMTRWSSGAPHAGSPSWMTALVERLHRAQTEEEATHEAWLRRYCREVRARLKSA